MKYTIIVLAFLLNSQLIKAQTKTYEWDDIHSNINFSVDYLKISEATGRFTKSSGSLIYSQDDFEDAQLSIQVEVGSISTDNEDRDGHLKSPDFFDEQHYPTIIFESTYFKSIGNNKYEVSGELTMKGITKSIIATAKYLGESQDAYGKTFSLWKVDFAVNRQDYGVSFNKTNAAGDMVLGDEVRLSINAKFILIKK